MENDILKKIKQLRESKEQFSHFKDKYYRLKEKFIALEKENKELKEKLSLEERQ